jgi:hypothetical protein
MQRDTTTSNSPPDDHQKSKADKVAQSQRIARLPIDSVSDNQVKEVVDQKHPRDDSDPCPNEAFRH